jgi:hypothetical protein
MTTPWDQPASALAPADDTTVIGAGILRSGNPALTGVDTRATAPEFLASIVCLNGFGHKVEPVGSG